MSNKYRYTIREDDLDGSVADFDRLATYVRKHFSGVSETGYMGTPPTHRALFFTAAPRDVKEGFTMLGLNTSFVDIITTTNLEPKSYA
jgi:hypothetical protein